MANKSIEVVHEDLTRRFDSELEWKDTIESKALGFLGFIGVALTLLFAVLIDNPSNRGPNSDLAIFPAVLMALGALLLMGAVFGYSIHAGPVPLEVFQARSGEEAATRTQLASAYGYSIAANRIKFYRARFLYQLAVLISAVAIFQLAIDLAAVGLDPTRGNVGGWQLVPWLPGVLLTVVAFIFLVGRDVPVQRKVKKDLISWQDEGGA